MQDEFPVAARRAISQIAMVARCPASRRKGGSQPCLQTVTMQKEGARIDHQQIQGMFLKLFYSSKGCHFIFVPPVISLTSNVCFVASGVGCRPDTNHAPVRPSKLQMVQLPTAPHVGWIASCQNSWLAIRGRHCPGTPAAQPGNSLPWSKVEKVPSVWQDLRPDRRALSFLPSWHETGLTQSEGPQPEPHCEAGRSQL